MIATPVGQPQAVEECICCEECPECICHAACDICGYQDCICDAKADAEWEQQQEYSGNRCPPRE